jgi:putative membrane-bound dehydrogenase domain
MSGTRLLPLPHTTRTASLAAIALAFAGQPLFAQRDLTDIPAPDPVAERAALTVADGYEVTLFASDPMIAKPLQINFDPQGRLWVSSSKVYPQIQPGEVANDTVTVLEDRDGDGVADHYTVFADGLLMPTAVLPGDGGAYVANSTEMLHLADTDGDGTADTRRVILAGFGAEDTHHILHTFRWGPDARLFFNQSIYIHSHVETPSGVKRLNGGGIWRFLPRTLALDIFARGWVNPWGHAFDPHGRSLVTDGAAGKGSTTGFPGPPTRRPWAPRASCTA